MIVLPGSTASTVRRRLAAIVVLLISASAPAPFAFREPQDAGRFDPFVVESPEVFASPEGVSLASLGFSDPARSAWSSFQQENGQDWQITIDGRTGVPLLVQGQGIPWAGVPDGVLPAATPISIEALGATLREFVATHPLLLGATVDEMALRPGGSTALTPELWQIQFDHVVSGVPVTGDRYVFYVSHGRLVAFGATRWCKVTTSPVPAMTSPDARSALTRYMGLSETEPIELIDPGSLVLTPLPPDARPSGSPPGPSAPGYGTALTWKFALSVPDEPGTWVGLVDAHSGEVLALFDDDRYARVKGGVISSTPDQPCPGCEKPGTPIPFARVTINGATSDANRAGLFDCSPEGATATTMLRGPYARINDDCGPISASATCPDDLDLGSGPGTDCDVPPGASAGNTHASRTGFFHINRLREHARAWLADGIPWLDQQLQDRVNIDRSCNAFWNGTTINFYRSSATCRNIGEIPEVIAHEWGHGLDVNDGGGYDNPSEAYADVTSFLRSHDSCLARGFFRSGLCSGYGNGCLSCEGVREIDWKQKTAVAPTTTEFVRSHCNLGNGPCVKQVHCESAVASEAMWDFAARDLPAQGFDANTAWQLADELWYRSRPGAGGNIYSCSSFGSTGCGAISWFTRLRLVDDDDGNLTNGTPHAAAIFAAFDRHGIACGAADEPTNQSSSGCPALGAPTLSAAPGARSAALAWSGVENAASYRVFRNDTGCASAFTPVANVTETKYADKPADLLPAYYVVQALGSNAACKGTLSNCERVVPAPPGGRVSTDRDAYGCGSKVTIVLNDENLRVPSATVHVRSGSEPDPEVISMIPVAPGATRYEGSIMTTGDPAGQDGRIAAADGDTITIEYVDADDGEGHANVARDATVRADCKAPVISDVRATRVGDESAVISWRTTEAASSRVVYSFRPTEPMEASSAELVTSHRIVLSDLTPCTPYVFRVESRDAVGNVASDDADGQGYSFATGIDHPVTYTSADTPLAIPDGDLAGATSVITVMDDRVPSDMELAVSIDHTYDFDLRLTLITPEGRAIRLSANRGGSGDGYAGTVFDDEADADIIWGHPPFTGEFKPEHALVPELPVTLEAAGVWKLSVVDESPGDNGRIVSWSLTFTHPSTSCAGPHVRAASSFLVDDECSLGGRGSRDGIAAPGERVRFGVALENDGSTPLTGITAKVTVVTEGGVMIQDLASFDDLPVGGMVQSREPHFEVQLPAGELEWGDHIDYRVAVSAHEGSWAGTFRQAVGGIVTVPGPSILETFVDNGSFCTLPVQWTNEGPINWRTCGGPLRPYAYPMSYPVAKIDSETYVVEPIQAALVAPVEDLRNATSVHLEFDQSYQWLGQFPGNQADVEIRSSRTGNVWESVLRFQGTPSVVSHPVLDISDQAAGAANVQVRFKYMSAHSDGWWLIDNVLVRSDQDVQSMTACPSPGPPPIPDGIVGTPMKAEKSDPEGRTLHVTWDPGACYTPGHELLYGPLEDVAEYAISGARCYLHGDGLDWSDVPQGNLWFVIVSNDTYGVEGTWGRDSAGTHRKGATASGLCGNAVRNNAGICP